MLLRVKSAFRFFVHSNILLRKIFCCTGIGKDSAKRSLGFTITFILNQGLTLARGSPRLHGRAANARRLRPGALALCVTSFRSAKTRYNANLGKYSLREYWIGANFKAHVPGRSGEQCSDSGTASLEIRKSHVKGQTPLNNPR